MAVVETEYDVHRFDYDGPPDEVQLAEEFAESTFCPKDLTRELGEWRAGDGRGEWVDSAEVRSCLINFLRGVYVDGEELRVTRRLLDDVYELLKVIRHFPPGWREEFV